MIKINGEIVEQNHFPDGTLLAKKACSCMVVPAIIEWKYENDAELFTLICLKRHLDDNALGIKTYLNLPYVPHARMDRVKNSEDIFTLKYFCEVINSLGFTHVRVIDPHSNVCTALINNVRMLSPQPYITNTIINCQPDLLFYPDEGAMKRYSSMAEKEYTFGIKRRDWATGKIEGLDLSGNVDKINGADILIIDDICSRGGTFYHSAKALKEAGAKNIYLYVTHCENTILEGDLLTSGLIEKVYTTNSIFTKEHEKIEVFEI